MSCPEIKDSDASPADRPRSALGETLGVLAKTAKQLGNTKFGGSVGKYINTMFPPTQRIIDRLVQLGYDKAKSINDYFKKSRALTESYLRRANDRVIAPLLNLKKSDLESFELLSDLANEASNYKIDPFNPRSKYENDTFEYKDEDGRTVSENGGVLWDRLDVKRKALDARNTEATGYLKNLFEEYQFFRNTFLEKLIKQVKIRAGEANVPDNQTSAETFEAISAIRTAFGEADADAYISFIREGDHVVNIFDVEKITETDAEGNSVTRLQKKEGNDALTSHSFTSALEQQAFIKSELARLQQEYGDDGFTPQLAEELGIIVQFKKTEALDGKKSMDSVYSGRLNDVFRKIEGQLDKSLLYIDPTLPADVKEQRRVEVGKTKDQLNTMLKQLFPETSVRKNLTTPRKGTPGYMTDVLEAFAQMSNRYAVQLGALEHTAEYSRDMGDLRKKLIAETGLIDEGKERKDEITNLLEGLQNIRDSQGMIPGALDKWANFANRFGFMWYMGFNPMTAVVNSLQVAMVTYPAMRAKFGSSNDTLLGIEQEIIKAYGTVFKTSKLLNMTMSERLEQLSLLDEKTLKREYDLTKDELDMLIFNDERGELRSGMHVYDMDSVLANTSGYQQTLDTFNRMSGFMFQKAELFNREVTALAAYRLATTKKRLGKSKPLAKGSKEAFEFSNRSIVESQGSYASDQAPGVFRFPAVRFFAMFKKYPAFMANLYVNMFKQMLGKSFPEGAETSAEKRAVKIEARRQFIGMMGMAALMAGATGMPFYYILRDTVNVVMDDKDDPFDFDLEFAQFLTRHMGEDAAQIFYKGLLNHATGLDFQSRISYNGIFLLGGGNISSNSPYLGGILGLRDVKGDTMDDQFTELLKEAIGAGPSIVFTAIQGSQDIANGDVVRGVEKIMPIAARNMVKTYRYEEEDGVRTRRGDAVVEDLTVKDLTFQFMGASPARVSLRYEINRKTKDLEQAILQRKNNLADRYFRLERKYGRGSKEVQEFKRKVLDSYNKSMVDRGLPSLRIDSKFLAKSRKIRRKFTEGQVFDGVSINKRLQQNLLPYQRLFTPEGKDEET